MAKIKAYISSDLEDFVSIQAAKNLLRSSDFINQLVAFSKELFEAYQVDSVVELRAKLGTTPQNLESPKEVESLKSIEHLEKPQTEAPPRINGKSALNSLSKKQ